MTGMMYGMPVIIFFLQYLLQVVSLCTGRFQMLIKYCKNLPLNNPLKIIAGVKLMQAKKDIEVKHRKRK